MKRLLFGILLLAAPAFPSAANIYLAQSSGTVTCNGVSQTASAYTFFNTGGNWGAGGSQIGPDTVVWIVGTVTASANTSPFTFQGSGTSGHPITLKFCNNAVLQAPYFAGSIFTANGGIVANSKNWLVIDGGTNGIVQNTANGTSGTYANSQSSQGVAVTGSGNVTVQNLTVQNIYVKTTIGDTAGTGNTAGIMFDGTNNVTISNNKVSGASLGISMGYEGASGITAATISGNTVTQGCHLITIGDGTSSSTASGITVSGNTVTSVDIWNDPSSACHSDGIGPISAFNASSTLSNSSFYNNTITGNMCTTSVGTTCTAFLFFTGNMSGINVYNNIFQSTGSATYESLLRFAAGRTDNTGTMATFGVYNNTFDCGSVGPIGTKWSAAGSNVSAQTFKNNITVGCGWGLNAADGTVGSWSWLTANNNDYFNNGFIAQSATGGTYTFGTWQSAGFDAAGSNSNPIFGTSYALTSGSAAIGLGANLTSLTITPLDSDIINVARPGSGAWDAGVRQFASTPPPTWNPGVTISKDLLPPTNLRVVSIDGVPISQAVAVPEERTPYWALASRQDRRQ